MIMAPPAWIAELPLSARLLLVIKTQIKLFVIINHGDSEPIQSGVARFL
jgi:hypothetical protein